MRTCCWSWRQSKQLLSLTKVNGNQLRKSLFQSQNLTYLLAAHMRRNKEYRNSNFPLLLEYLQSSECLLQNYDSPEDLSELYQTYGALWLDRMSQITNAERNARARNAAREKSKYYFTKAIYLSISANKIIAGELGLKGKCMPTSSLPQYSQIALQPSHWLKKNQFHPVTLKKPKNTFKSSSSNSVAVYLGQH